MTTKSTKCSLFQTLRDLRNLQGIEKTYPKSRVYFLNIFFRVFGPAWLAYGHSFALENEHDQAMAAYFKASQLMKG